MVLNIFSRMPAILQLWKVSIYSKINCKSDSYIAKKLASQFNSGFIIGEKNIWNSEKALADIISFNDINYATIHNSLAKTIALILSRILKTLYNDGYITWK